MSGSDRDKQSPLGLAFTVLVAVAGIALYWSMFYSMGFSSGYHEKQAHVEREHYASDTPNEVERECGAKAGSELRKCITEIVKAERESQRNESDLAAQWKAADWVLWAGVIAGAQLIATLAGLYYVKRTLDATLEAVEDTGLATRAMERQNELAEDTAKRQLRAYITAEDHLLIDFQIGLKSKHLCKIYNRGQTPAYDVKIWSRPSAVVTSEVSPHDAKIRKQERFVQSTAVLGPGQFVTHQNANTGPLTEDSYLGISVGGIAIIWGGVVSYRDAFGRRRRTTFKYYVMGEGEALSGHLDMMACSRGNVAD